MKTHIEGMKAVLAACAKHQVKRLVHTSSVAAVTWVKEDEKPDSEYGLFDETFWSDAPELDPNVGPVSGPYVYGKTKSESFAWEF
jgi:dihydroflavonol-4-reductase